MGLQLFLDSQWVISDLYVFERVNTIWGMIRYLRQGIETTALWAGWDLGLREQAIKIGIEAMSYRGGGCFSQSTYLFLQTRT